MGGCRGNDQQTLRRTQDIAPNISALGKHALDFSRLDVEYEFSLWLWLPKRQNPLLDCESSTGNQRVQHDSQLRRGELSRWAILFLVTDLLGQRAMSFGNLKDEELASSAFLTDS